jgi:hypothetical protein
LKLKFEKEEREKGIPLKEKKEERGKIMGKTKVERKKINLKMGQN